MLTWEFSGLPGVATDDGSGDTRREDLVDVGEKLLGLGEKAPDAANALEPSKEDEKPSEPKDAKKKELKKEVKNLRGLAKVAKEFDLDENGKIQIVELTATDAKESENKPAGWKLTLSATKSVREWPYDKHTRMIIGVARAIKQLTGAKFVSSVKDGTAK